MTLGQQQAIRRTDSGPDQTEIPRGFEQAGIPALPTRQQLFNLISKTHFKTGLNWVTLFDSNLYDPLDLHNQPGLNATTEARGPRFGRRPAAEARGAIGFLT